LGSTLIVSLEGWDTDKTYSFQWKRNGIAIQGAVGLEYKLLDVDWVTNVSVDVYVETQGSKLLVKSSMDIWVGVNLEFSNPKVTIAGGELVGDALTATALVQETSPAFTYQWLSNGANIAGATAPTYSLVRTDVGKKISVRVKISKLGWAPINVSSNEILVYAGVILTAPTPTLILPGKLAVGEVVTGVAGSWGFISSPSYSWICGGGATYGIGQTFTIRNDLYGDSCFLRVTGSAQGYRSVSRDSASFAVTEKAKMSSVPTPTVKGAAQLGKDICVDTGPWDTGVTLTKTWIRDDGVIFPRWGGGANDCATLRPEDVGHGVRVVVTGKRFGFEDETRTSLTTSKVIGGTFTGSLTRGLGIDVPNKRLIVELNKSLTPAPTSSRIIWFRDGKEIVGANEFTYVWSEWDQGRTLSHKVVVSRAGFASAESQSSGYLIPGDKTVICSTPSPGGKWVVGGMLTANVFQIEEGASISYQWYRNDQPIASATSRTYTLTKQDEGTASSVEVVASKSGFVSVTKRSMGVRVAGSAASTPQPISGSIISSPIPTVQGSFQVGQELKVLTGQWDSDVTLQILWFRDGQAIQSATDFLYKVTMDDLGKRISVSVTGSKSQAPSVTRRSNEGRVTSLPTSFTPVRPTVSGKPKVTNRLAVVTGNWCAECTYQYQWLLNGKPIRGAKSKVFLLQKSHAGRVISVSVIGKNLEGLSKTLKSVGVRVLSR
jgi:hypothetical protein